MSGYPHNPPPGYGYGQPYNAPPYGGAPQPQPYAPPPLDDNNPHSYGPRVAYPTAGYASPFAALVPSTFPPNTDPNVVACFQMADQDGSGFIDDNEQHRALSSYNHGFSIRTVHLLIKFERFDQGRSGKIDMNELRDALLSLGFAVSPVVLDLLVSKFDRSGGTNKAIEYDNFIECCLIVKGLTEKFKEKDTSYTGSATFTYEIFMLTVLPFVIAG